MICLSSTTHSVCCLSLISSSFCNFHANASSLSNCLLLSSSTNLCSLASCCRWKSSLILASIDLVSLPCLFASLRNCSSAFFHFCFLSFIRLPSELVLVRIESLWVRFLPSFKHGSLLFQSWTSAAILIAS